MKLIRPRFLRRLRNVFSLVVSSLFVALPLAAVEPSSRTLDSDWQFREVGNTGRPDIRSGIPRRFRA
jgi:hypothetical protein